MRAWKIKQDCSYVDNCKSFMTVRDLEFNSWPKKKKAL